jgi:hypothetical protein
MPSAWAIATVALQIALPPGSVSISLTKLRSSLMLCSGYAIRKFAVAQLLGREIHAYAQIAHTQCIE